MLAKQAMRNGATRKRPDCGGADGPSIHAGKQLRPPPPPRTLRAGGLRHHALTRCSSSGLGSRRALLAYDLRPVTVAAGVRRCRGFSWPTAAVAGNSSCQRAAANGSGRKRRSSCLRRSCSFTSTVRRHRHHVAGLVRTSASMACRRHAGNARPAGRLRRASSLPGSSESNPRAAAGCRNAAQPGLSTVNAVFLTAATRYWQATVLPCRPAAAKASCQPP